MNNNYVVFPGKITWDSNTYRSHTQNNNNVTPYDIWKHYEIDPINNRIDDEEEEKKNYDIDSDLEYENAKIKTILPKQNTMWPMYNTDFDSIYLENTMMNPVFNPNRLFNPNR